MQFQSVRPVTCRCVCVKYTSQASEASSPDHGTCAQRHAEASGGFIWDALLRSPSRTPQATDSSNAQRQRAIARYRRKLLRRPCKHACIYLAAGLLTSLYMTLEPRAKEPRLFQCAGPKQGQGARMSSKRCVHAEPQIPRFPVPGPPGAPRPHKEPQPHFFKSRSRQADKASCTRAFQKAQTSTCSSIPLYPIIPCHPATGKLKGRSVHAALDLPQAEQPSICESSQLPPCHSATGVAFVWLRYGCSLKPLLPLVTERSIVLGISAAHLKVSGTKIVVQHSMMMQ